MKYNEFKIGSFFKSNTGLWLCTDIGTRVIVAIKKTADWMTGPPYALEETVFDEDEQQACSLEST
jgi:hypothetical protein